MGLSLKPKDKNNNWRENNRDHITLKSDATKYDTKLEEEDDSRQCSVTLYPQSKLPLIEFNRTLPQLHRPYHRIPLSKEYFLPQVIV